MLNHELIVYRAFEPEEGQILEDIAFLMERGEAMAQEGGEARGKARDLLHRSVNSLLELAGTNGFYGNLWHCYLANLLVNHENSYSRACEIRGAVEGTVNEAALHDIAIFKQLYDYDFGPLTAALDMPFFGMVLSYEPCPEAGRIYNTRIRDRICALARQMSGARTAQEMKDELTGFYREYGVGKFGLHKAFRVARDEHGVHIVPILNIRHVHMDDLVGYELAKEKLIENTEAFVAGKPANNCLLYGDAGTGKSSSIKAITNEYYDRGLRIIEVYKHQFQDLNEVIAQIKSRNYRFIIYMDDLSFEDFEIEYKYLKAVIEGGLEKKPENVLIYATSNRRHLIRESFHDRDGTDFSEKHGGDTVQEKLSLASRFGVSIYFGAPSMEEYQQIVEKLAQRNGIETAGEELRQEAVRWEMRHGGFSGRTAQQFIDHLLGKEQQ
ncbi:MAG: ATP-binding protein [Eubacteriales bacterium]|nr:ATP-binding protein [Eubacteriales bacterium]